MIKTKKCKRCGKEFTTDCNSKVYCSPACQKKAQQKRAQMLNRIETYICAWCGVKFKAERKRKYCCERCRLKANGRLLDTPRKKPKNFMSIEEVARASREMNMSAGEYMAKFCYGKEG